MFATNFSQIDCVKKKQKGLEPALTDHTGDQIHPTRKIQILQSFQKIINSTMANAGWTQLVVVGGAWSATVNDFIMQPIEYTTGFMCARARESERENRGRMTGNNVSHREAIVQQHRPYQSMHNHPITAPFELSCLPERTIQTNSLQVHWLLYTLAWWPSWVTRRNPPRFRF